MILAALGVIPSPPLPFLTPTGAEAPFTICISRPALSMKYEPSLIEAPPASAGAGSAVVPARMVSSAASSSSGLCCNGVKIPLGSRASAASSSSSRDGSLGRGRQV